MGGFFLALVKSLHPLPSLRCNLQRLSATFHTAPEHLVTPFVLGIYLFNRSPKLVHPLCIDAFRAAPHSRTHRATRGGGDNEQERKFGEFASKPGGTRGDRLRHAGFGKEYLRHPKRGPG